MLKLWCHYASLDKFYNLNIWIVLALLYSKVRAIFAMRLSVTALYVVHMLKLQGHYASFDKFYNLSIWIVPALLYLKVTALLALSWTFLQNFKIFIRFLRILNNSITLAWHCLYLDFILAIYRLSKMRQ